MTTYIDWSDVESAASELAGNHRRFESFAWHDRPDDDENWAIVYVSNRDSGLLEQSNASAIAVELESHLTQDDPDIVEERHGHWAVGYVDGYAIRVYRQGGDERSVTPAFKAWCELQARLADYAMLDEEDFSQREYEATIDNIRDAGRRFVIDNPPDDWAERCWEWLWDNTPSAIENRDDQGGYPSDDALREALTELDLLDATYTIELDGEVILETVSRKRAQSEFHTLEYHASMGIGLAYGRSLEMLCDGETMLVSCDPVGSA